VHHIIFGNEQKELVVKLKARKTSPIFGSTADTTRKQSEDERCKMEKNCLFLLLQYKSIYIRFLCYNYNAKVDPQQESDRQKGRHHLLLGSGSSAITPGH
jgi:hypothetical protein